VDRRYGVGVPYAVENALYQWEEGERRLRGARELERGQLTAAADAVVHELRRRLGGPFTLGELADLYGAGTDWAEDIAERRFAGTDGAYVVDAAFGRYARFASDFAGGRLREF
jgi:hypothetical protein